MPQNNEETNEINTKRKTNKNLIIFDIIELILIAIIVVLFYISIPLTSTKVLYIPKGSTTNTVSYLKKNGFELNFIDSFILKFTGYIQSGWIDIGQTRLTKMDFLHKLTTSKAALKNITLIPGETSYIFLKDLSKKMNLSHKRLEKIYEKYAYKKDGNILANTYSLPYGMNEEHLILYLLSQTNKKYESFSKKIFGIYDKKKWYYYLSLASIIQKEAASVNEMPIVSSVIHNRLKKGMKLQMDGTLNYGKYSHTKVTAKRIREDDTSYNTYKFKGLPSNPICAVGLNAIKAAIFPVKTSYLYFVKDNKTGLHKFSNSYKKHNQNIKANIGVKKTYTKVKEKEDKIDKEAKEIMKTDVSKQKPTTIKSLWENVK